MAGAGADVGLLHTETGREAVPIVVRTDRARRGTLADLAGVSLHAPDGRMVPLASLVRIVPTVQERPLKVCLKMLVVRLRYRRVDDHLSSFVVRCLTNSDTAVLWKLAPVDLPLNVCLLV